MASTPDADVGALAWSTNVRFELEDMSRYVTFAVVCECLSMVVRSVLFVPNPTSDVGCRAIYHQAPPARMTVLVNRGRAALPRSSDGVQLLCTGWTAQMYRTWSTMTAHWTRTNFFALLDN